MNRYFAHETVKGDYFADIATPSTSGNLPVEAVRRRKVEPRSVLEKVVSIYGDKRSGIVRRRYGIK